jgi:polysaccharide pyruvyl transferase WcaK-like protein
MSRDGVYLYGYYGQGNLGDDLLMVSAVGMIRALRPDAPVFVHCHDPARLPALGDPDLRPVPASTALADRALSKPRRLLRHFGLLRQAFAQCDTLVFGGGTVLQESRSPLSVLLIAAMATLARLRGLRIVLLGSGLGEPRTWAGRFALRHVLRRASAAGLRDRRSFDLARALAPKLAASETADLVFALPPPLVQAGGRMATVALSIQPSLTARDDAAGASARNPSATSRSSLRAGGHDVRLLIFESKTGGVQGVDDAAAWRQVLGDVIDDPASGMALTADAAGASLDQAAATLFADCAAHIGMRFHGHVIAALAGVPFVGLSHDIKIAEIGRMFAMPCLDVAGTSAEAILAALAQAKGAAVSPAILADLRAAAARNLDVLRSVIGDAPPDRQFPLPSQRSR